MPTHVKDHTVVPAAGDPPKTIREVVGRVNSGTASVSVARMSSPPGWVEPGQRPEFEEVTYVLEGAILVEHEGGSFEVGPGEAVVAQPGEWVRYSTPHGAEYVAVCVPAFDLGAAHRDA